MSPRQQIVATACKDILKELNFSYEKKNFIGIMTCYCIMKEKQFLLFEIFVENLGPVGLKNLAKCLSERNYAYSDWKE